LSYFFPTEEPAVPPTTTDPDIPGKNPKTPKSCQYPKPQNEPAEDQQAIQKQLLRRQKRNSRKAVISFTQPGKIEEENKFPDRPGDQPGLSHLNPRQPKELTPNPFICKILPVTPLIGGF
jgi:hypothetical protein